MNIEVNGRKVLTAKEAAQRYGYAVRSIRFMIETAKIEVVKVDKFNLVYADSLEGYISNRDVRGKRGNVRIPDVQS